KMGGLERRFEEVSHLLGTAEVINKRDEYLKLSREYAELDPLVKAWRKYSGMLADLAGLREMVGKGDELAELAREELRELEGKKPAAEQELKILLLPKDPSDGKNAILEIRAGTGG